MTSSTIIMILAIAVVLLAVVVAVMVWLFWRKNRELKQKNEAIVCEIHRSQNIIERAVKHGVSRAALLSLPAMAVLTLASCTKDGDTIYQTDPDDMASTAPLVTVIYDVNAVGDGNYNDLIYQGVEQVAKEHGLRTQQLSPSSRDEGLGYLETVLQQMSTQQDTVRHLLIVAASGYDDYLRQNNDRLSANPYADLLYLETTTPLTGKGSTLFMPYYGAMYEAGAIAQALALEVLLVAANPKTESVTDAAKGFADGFNTNYIDFPESYVESKSLVIEYLSDQADGGFTVADSTALRIMYDRQWNGSFRMLVPVCRGAIRAFQYLCNLMGDYSYMGVNAVYNSSRCPLSAIKHIDRAVGLCISQWLSAEGMPKHQMLGMADGYSEVVAEPANSLFYDLLGDVLTDDFLTTIHDDAIRKEAEHEK